MNQLLHHAFLTAALGLMLAQCGTKPELAKVEAPPLPDDSWQTYTGPDEYYSIHHPRAWRVEEQEGNATITSDDSTAAISVAFFIGEEPVDDFLNGWLEEMFKTAVPTSDLARLSLNGWNGVWRTFRDTANQREWTGLAASRGEVFVMATATDESRRWEERRGVLERALRSLVLYGE